MQMEPKSSHRLTMDYIVTSPWPFHFLYVLQLIIIYKKQHGDGVKNKMGPFVVHVFKMLLQTPLR